MLVVFSPASYLLPKFHVSFSQPIMKLSAFSELYPKISPFPLSSPKLHVIYIYFCNLLAELALWFLFYSLCISMETEFMHACFFPASCGIRVHGDCLSSFPRPLYAASSQIFTLMPDFSVLLLTHILKSLSDTSSS